MSLQNLFYNKYLFIANCIAFIDCLHTLKCKVVGNRDPWVMSSFIFRKDGNDRVVSIEVIGSENVPDVHDNKTKSIL